ncbi:hypothetical protein FRB91_004404 [Serendipita sp. 411]|nr:hypothetical protein FRB91_004404 [Serendipita sp. 411]
MFFTFSSVDVTRTQDLLWALIYPNEKSPPPTSTQPKAPLDFLWSLIYPDKLQSKPTLPTSTEPQPQSQPRPLQERVPTEAKPIVETIVNKTSSLFALIIGIDEYKSPDLNRLGGAVADAKAIKDYLETSLGVPTSQIKTLYNAEATRNAIVENLRALKMNSSIQVGDPILIFYAGHGGTGATPPGWEAGGPEIQLLLSHDALCEENGCKIYGLPDRTMNVLLFQLAEEKGDNIVRVVLPSLDAIIIQVRGAKLVVDVPSKLDEHIWGGTRGMAIKPNFLNSGLGSHVLLAACGAKETAKENSARTRGVFTKALLDSLLTVGADKVTYTDLIQRLPSLPGQNPQCEGHNQNRILFNSKAPSQRRHLYAVHEKDGEYILKAGAAHGITKGATFDVYRDKDCVESEAPLARLMVSKPPRPFSAVLSGQKFNIDKQPFALQTSAGDEEDLLVHAALDPKLEKVYEALAEEIKGTRSGQQQIRLVEEDQIGIAHLGIAIENNSVVFNILNPLVVAYGLKRMPFQLDHPTVGDLRLIFRSAAHFYWHLRRTGKAKILQEKVTISFTRLKEDEEEEYDDDFNLIRKRDGPNLIQDGILDLVVEDDVVYGIKVTNNSDKPLYISAFYFDNSDLSITSYFQPPTARNKVDPPLPAHQSLTIGYGAGGGRPFHYFLPDGQDVDVGFLKFFISTEPVDLSAIPQFSPFETGRMSVRVPDKPLGIWSTMLITVVQRRKASS